MNKVSLPKKTGAGTPVPKHPNLIIIALKDITKDASGNYTGYPARDSGGVKMTGNIALAGGAKAIGLYLTPSTILRNDTSEGEDDAMGFIQNLVGHHPGDSLQFNEWVQNHINEDLILISRECSDSTGTRVLGTPCNPIKLSYEGQDNNEGKKGILTFAQKMRSGFKMGHYTGTIPTLADDADYAGTGSDESGA